MSTFHPRVHRLTAESFLDNCPNFKFPVCHQSQNPQGSLAEYHIFRSFTALVTGTCCSISSEYKHSSQMVRCMADKLMIYMRKAGDQPCHHFC